MKLCGSSVNHICFYGIPNSESKIRRLILAYNYRLDLISFLMVPNHIVIRGKRKHG
jgi:hypothetical protein